MDKNEFLKHLREFILIFLQIILTGVVLYFTFVWGFQLIFWGIARGFSAFVLAPAVFLLPTLVIPLLWAENKPQVLKKWGIFAGIMAVAIGTNYGMIRYDEAITIDTSPNINIEEYLPFREESKIVKLDHEASLRLTGDLPKVDGAAAVFPVYSAFVHATYPDTTSLHGNYYDGEYHQTPDQSFKYNNTVTGYWQLGEKLTDIFFGAYPSEEQILTARRNGTEFVYTPIGYDAFVFFVNKDNPVDNLTTEQIQGIYSGEITNWNQVGGRNEPIAAYQRNNNSGSQSMLIRFMNGKTLMDPPADMHISLMSGMAQVASDYRNKTAAIGFSFRYYMEGIIQNPDVKLLSVDGVAPTPENIANGTYPITGYLYAVTWEGNENENVQKLLDWILSPEGQYIIEKTGYVPIGPTE